MFLTLGVRFFSTSLLAALVVGGLLTGCSPSMNGRASESTQNRSSEGQTERQTEGQTDPVQPDLVAGLSLKRGQTLSGQGENIDKTSRPPKGQTPFEKLVGVWLGQAYLDEAVLEQKLTSLSPDRQAEVIGVAQDFITTVMALDFHIDGSLQKEIEITPSGGQPLRDGGTGSWQVVQSEGDRALIQTTMALVDGEVVTDQAVVYFYPDGERLGLAVELGDELQGCNPMIVLYRQQLSDANVAQFGDGSVTK